MGEDDPDRFRAPAPIIELTPEVLAKLRTLLDKAQQHASINGLPWRGGANAGKPLLYGGAEGRGALIAHGTIGSWNEIDLAVAAVNALPAFLAALSTPAAQPVEGWPVDAQFKLGDVVSTPRAPFWRGTVCGWYRNSEGRLGFNVEAEAIPLAIHNYPQTGLVAACGRSEGRAVMTPTDDQIADVAGEDSAAPVPGRALLASLPEPVPVSALSGDDPSRIYIDCEFDGHGGELLSMALVRENGRSIYLCIADKPDLLDPWVEENVWPLVHARLPVGRTVAFVEDWGQLIRSFLGPMRSPVIVSDSPVDIWRFCETVSTGSNGEWKSTDFPRMTFEVHNVDCYPTTLSGAIQHNAWWDAMALRHKLLCDTDRSPQGTDAQRQDGEAATAGAEGIAP
jgi:hypothetical protein